MGTKSDMTYDNVDVTTVKRWVPLDEMLELVQQGGQRFYVDASAWSGIHIAPGDEAYFQPVIKIFHPDTEES